MNGHIPSGHTTNLNELMSTLDSLPEAALAQVRAHLDTLAQHRNQHGDDPTEAPES